MAMAVCFGAGEMLSCTVKVSLLVLQLLFLIFGDLPKPRKSLLLY